VSGAAPTPRGPCGDWGRMPAARGRGTPSGRCSEPAITEEARMVSGSAERAARAAWREARRMRDAIDGMTKDERMDG
jgi:hypothetical protein